MKKVSLLLAAVFAVSIFACMPASQNSKIDASSEKSLKTSVEKVRDSLTEDKKVEFDQSLMVVIFYSAQDEMQGIFDNNLEPTEEEIFAYIQKVLDGKTADEIIEQAKKIEKQMGLQLN